MAAPDFAAILQAWEVFTASDGHPALRARQGDDLLAARIIEACPDCHGEKCPRCGLWRVRNGWGDDYDCGPCSHPNAPTIGTALAEWWGTREGQT